METIFEIFGYVEAFTKTLDTTALTFLIIFVVLALLTLIQAIFVKLVYHPYLRTFPKRQAFFNRLGKWRVCYLDREYSMWMPKHIAKDYAEIFGGYIEKFDKKKHKEYINDY